MKTIQIIHYLFSALLLTSVSQFTFAEPNYPEDFTPQILYQDKEYIEQHSQPGTTVSSSTDQPCSCACNLSQVDSKVAGDFEPVILYQDKEYISNH